MKDNEQGKVQVLRYQRSDFQAEQWEWLYDSYVAQFAGLAGTDYCPLVMVQATSNGNILSANSMTGLFIYISPGLRDQELEHTVDRIEGSELTAEVKQDFADRLVNRQMGPREQQSFAYSAVRYNWRTHMIAPGVSLPSKA